MPWAEHPNIKAIVLPGLPGQESGNSLADILFGDVNPSGRLPYTIAKKREHYPAKINNGMSVSHSLKLFVLLLFLIAYTFFISSIILKVLILAIDGSTSTRSSPCMNSVMDYPTPNSNTVT